MAVSKVLSLALISTLFVSTSYAQLLTNPASTTGKGKAEVGVYLGGANTDYYLDKPDRSSSTQRSSLAAFGSFGLSDKVDLFLGAAYGFSVEDGSGHQLAIGAKGEAYTFEKTGLAVNWYLQYAGFDDNLGEEDEVTTETELGEFLIGAVASKSISDELSVYAGLEVVASSSGEAVAKKALLDDFVTDMERDNKVGIKAGLNYGIFEVHVGLIHESSILAGVSFPLDKMPSISLPKLPSWPARPKETEETEAAPAPVEAQVEEPKEEVREIELDLYEQPEMSARDKLRFLQEKLTKKGYNPGVADGYMGKRTRAAIRKFQEDVGIEVTGEADAATYKAMGIDQR